MAVISAPTRPTHVMNGTDFTSLATPSRGSRETAVWRIEMPPNTPPTPHSLTREEVFVVLAGSAEVTLDSTTATAGTGDAFVVPPDVRFVLRNAGAEMLELLCCMPVGGQGRLEDGTLLTPPWSE